MKISTQLNFDFCSFDFQAAGMSQGQYVTFGHLEMHDVCCILKDLELRYKKNAFILWGRSMGATTALLYCSKYKDQRIQGLILDSPFHDLNKIIIKLIQKKIYLPKILIKGVFQLIKRKIEDTASFKFDDIRLPKEINIQCRAAAFLASKHDRIIPFKYSQLIFDSYKGQKEQHLINCDHQENRDQNTLINLLNWVKINLKTSLQSKESKKENIFQISRMIVQKFGDQSVQYQDDKILSDREERLSLGQKIKNRIIKTPEKYMINNNSQEKSLQKFEISQNQLPKFYKIIIYQKKLIDGFQYRSKQYKNKTQNQQRKHNSAQKYKQKLEVELLDQYQKF